MSFFDRFRRKHESTERAVPKSQDTEIVAVEKKVKESSPASRSTTKEVVVPMLHRRQMLLSPVVTEKSERLSRTAHQYTFFVDPRANKLEVAQSFFSMYGVKPVRVNILRYAGERVTFRRKAGVTRQRKKAIITVPTGTTIDIVPTSVKE